jgi:hypothetical protein
MRARRGRSAGADERRTMSDSASMPHSAPEPLAELAESIRRALIEAAEAAYEDAGIQGLCEEGRWEAAVSAMRALKLDAGARETAPSADPQGPAGD